METWRLIFLVGLAVAIFGFLVAMWLIPEIRRKG